MMALLKNFLVCFGCNGHDYLTRVSAFSLADAEHIILDMSIGGKHICSVGYAQAFDFESIQTDTFAAMALSSTLISIDTAKKIIEDCNNFIHAQEARENRISELTAQIDAMQNELSTLRSASEIPF